MFGCGFSCMFQGIHCRAFGNCMHACKRKLQVLRWHNALLSGWSSPFTCLQGHCTYHLPFRKWHPWLEATSSFNVCISRIPAKWPAWRDIMMRFIAGYSKYKAALLSQFQVPGILPSCPCSFTFLTGHQDLPFNFFFSASAPSRSGLGSFGSPNFLPVSATFCGRRLRWPSVPSNSRPGLFPRLVKPGG